MTKLEAIAKVFDNELKESTVGNFMRKVREEGLMGKLTDCFHLLETGNQMAIATVIGGKPVIGTYLEPIEVVDKDVVNELQGN